MVHVQKAGKAGVGGPDRLQMSLHEVVILGRDRDQGKG